MLFAHFKMTGVKIQKHNISGMPHFPTARGWFSTLYASRSLGVPFRTIRAGSPCQVSFHLLEVQAFLFRARFERNSYFFETHRKFVYERVN